MDSKRKRESEDQHPFVPDWVKEALECPVCLETIVETPVYMCANNIAHSLCSECHSTLTSQKQPCPVCRQALTRNRSHVAEKLVESLPQVNCQHDGCSFRNPDQRKVHKHQEDDCGLREIPCGLCEKRVTPIAIAEHLNAKHGFQRFKPLRLNHDRSVVSTHVKDLAFADRPALADSQQFAYEVEASWGFSSSGDCKECFLINWATADDKCLLFWIALCGSKGDAEKYKYTLKIRSRKDWKAGDTNYLFEGTRRCVPCDISHQEMKQERCGVMIDKKLVQEAADGGKDVVYCMKIEQV